MNKIFSGIFCSLWLLSVGGTVNAATLDLSGQPGIVASPRDVGNAILTSTDGLFIGTIGTLSSNEGVCALNVSAFNCTEDLTVEFKDTVTNLTFRSNAYETGDQSLVSAFDASGFLLTSLSVTSNLFLIDLTGILTPIKTLIITDSGSTSLGIGYQDFSFDVVTPIPLPATLPFLVGSLGILGLLGRLKKQSTAKAA